MEKYINQITAFIQNNTDFKFLEIAESYNLVKGDSISLSADNSRNITYNNMGATIIDAILQAGLNYKNVVKPRVEKFKSEHNDVKTTTAFYNLINSTDLSKLINMKGQKIERIQTLTKFLKNEKIETEDDFYIWLSNTDNLLALSNLKGVKHKTIDYLKILTGHKETVAIDTRIINFIKQICPELENISYDFAKELLLKTAKNLRVDAATLDYSIWTFMAKPNFPSPTADKNNLTEKLDIMWNGYCPESELNGKTVRMRLNHWDFYESEETGLQIAVIAPGVQAVILKFKGKGKFRTTPSYADEIENGELLCPQTSDRPPFNDSEYFNNSSELEQYIKSIK